MSIVGRVWDLSSRAVLMARSLVLVRLSGSRDQGKKLELGSGPTRRPGWVTVDMCPGTDVFWDLRFPLPFRSRTFSFLYTSHVIEHFSYDRLSKLFWEMWRVLEDGAIMSVCVPDPRVFLNLYATKSELGDLLEYPPAVNSRQPMDVLNYIFYMDGQHKQMFDPESLVHHLQAHGFENCRERSFDASLDMPERRRTSFYVECRKPHTTAVSDLPTAEPTSTAK